MNNKIDRNLYQDSLARLYSIFKGMSDTVDEVSTWRCPYKNVKDRCTAKFGCRNQDRADVVSGLFRCTGSDDLDYLGAWEN